MSSRRRRLWRASSSVMSSARSSSSPATSAAASTVQPSTNTATVSSSDRSATSRRPTLHSTVARKVWWRAGMSTVPDPRASSDLASRCSRASGSSSRVRAAASSMASGSPSRRRQISTTAAALPSVRVRSGRTARARSRKRATPGDAASSLTGTPAGSDGSGSGGTGYSRSARSRSGVRLVAMIARPGQRDRSSSRSRATSSTCSKLSRISSHRPSPSCSIRASCGESMPPSSAPSARPIAIGTSSASFTPSSGTNRVPESKRSLSRSPTATASRVLPTPLGPVRVRRRPPPPPSSSAISSMARSRPTSDVVLAGRGRGERPGGGGRAAAKRSLSSVARSSRTSRPSSRAVLKYRYESAASALTRPSISVRRGSRSGAGRLMYSRRGRPLESSSSSSSPETSIPGPTSP